MPFESGKVEAVSIKPLNEPDRFGNTYRAALKVGETFFSYGTIKKDAINIKCGSEWVQLQKGMDVEFQFSENGDFKNIKKQSFTITDTSGGQAPAPKQQQQSKPQQPSSGGSFVNPAEVGQCLNLAAEVLKLSKEDLVNPDKVSEAIAWYKQVRETFNNIYPTVEASGSKAPPKKDKPPFKADKPQYDEEMDFEDDI